MQMSQKNTSLLQDHIPQLFSYPLSHSSYSFAPILQPVIIALACASAAPIQYEKSAICIAYERAVTFIP